MARNYKKLEIYHLAYDSTLQIYKATEKFPDSEHKNISLQIRRAVVSIPLNIAEGSSRRSNREFLQFLTYAFGSAKEVEVLLNLSKDLDYINKKMFEELFEDLNKLMAKLFLFMRDLEKRVPEKKYHFFQKLENKMSEL
ncbi:MAG: four helix bundle protein [Candidatus Woesearchaeota archaeon]